MAQSFKCSFKTDNKPIFIVDSVNTKDRFGRAKIGGLHDF